MVDYISYLPEFDGSMIFGVLTWFILIIVGGILVGIGSFFLIKRMKFNKKINECEKIRFHNFCDIRIIKEHPRPSTLFIKKHLNGELVGAEIGVKDGKNAKSMLKLLPIKKLYLIDPYKSYSDWSGNLSQSWQDKIKNKAYKKLSKFKDKITWIEKSSEDAIYDIPDNLDFVYIDGNHNYEFVSKDMRLYYEKVRIGGILAGHDIVNVVVRKAFINELQLKYKLFPYYERDDWWVFKC